MSTDKGPVYHLAGRVEFDTETLPAALEGLEVIGVSRHTSGDLRSRIAYTLLRVWGEVAGWKRVWGPRSAQAMARALGKIAADDLTEDSVRARIIKAFGSGLERISVVRALRDIFSHPSDSTDVNRLAVETALAMLDQWIEPEIAPEELAAVVTVAALAVGRPGLPARSVRVRKLRERTIELLYEALRAGEPWCRDPLEKLRDSPSVPKRLRTEIAGRLKKAFTLVKP